MGARPLAAVPRPLSCARRPPVGARRRAARGPQHRPAGQPRRAGRHRRGRAGDERHAGGPDHRRIISPSGSKDFQSASASWRTAFRSAASSTISTRARSPRRCARGGRLLEARRSKDTKFPPWPCFRSSKSPIRACARSPRPSRRSTTRCARWSPTCSRRCTQRPGIGLAAIQVGVPKRLLVIDLQEPEEEGGEPVRDPRVFINPEILEHSDQEVPYTEGCLSVPDQYAEVDRPDRIRARWLDLRRQGPRGRDRRPARDLPAARDGPSERRAVHRPSLAPEARDDPQEARQAPERAEGGLILPGTGRGTIHRRVNGGGGVVQGSNPPPSALRAATSPFRGGIKPPRPPPSPHCGNPPRIRGTSARTACNARDHASRTRPRMRRKRAHIARASPARSRRSSPSGEGRRSRPRRKCPRNRGTGGCTGRMSMASAEQASAQLQAHLRAIHRVMHGVAKRLVDVAVHVRVQGDHFADGHGHSP